VQQLPLRLRLQALRPDSAQTKVAGAVAAVGVATKARTEADVAVGVGAREVTQAAAEEAAPAAVDQAAVDQVLDQADRAEADLAVRVEGADAAAVAAVVAAAARAPPHRDLAATQRWIFENVLRKLPTHAAAHGFVTGRSILTNATPHVGQQILVNADLQNFFPTITFHRVLGAFTQLGYSPAAATILALLVTESPRRIVEYAGQRFHVATGPRALPQGACTSPAISNLIARRLDSRLAGIAAKLGWTYTRYADDLSFSASSAAERLPQAGYLLARIRHIAQDEGFAVNEKKTRVLKQSAAMAVTGVIVNQQPGVSRRQRRRLRAVLHNANRHGLASQNRASHPHFESQLRGQIEFVQMVNPDQARPLLDAFAAIGNSR
jgi:RNA-directed DNA polymerase